MIKPTVSSVFVVGSFHLNDGRYRFKAIELLKYMYCLKLYMLVNAISLKPFHKSTSNLKLVFIMSRGRTLLIFGHLLKTRWLPTLVKTISLESFHRPTSNLIKLSQLYKHLFCGAYNVLNRRIHIN